MDKFKLESIIESIQEDNSELRRARLNALTQIASAHNDIRGEPTEALRNILSLDVGSERDEALAEFFEKYIPGGWITEITVEDQEFLRNVTISGNPFWYDWG